MYLLWILVDFVYLFICLFVIVYLFLLLYLYRFQWIMYVSICLFTFYCLFSTPFTLKKKKKITFLWNEPFCSMEFQQLLTLASISVRIAVIFIDLTVLKTKAHKLLVLYYSQLISSYLDVSGLPQGTSLACAGIEGSLFLTKIKLTGPTFSLISWLFPVPASPQKSDSCLFSFFLQCCYCVALTSHILYKELYWEN